MLGSLLMKRLSEAGLKGIPGPYDVSDSSAVDQWMETTRPDILFHLAAIVPVQAVESDPVAAMRVNAFSPLVVVDAIARLAPRCWMFFSSSSHVYKPSSATTASRAKVSEESANAPLTLYGATKFAGECVARPLAERLQVDLCIGRIFSYFHQRQPPAFLVPGLIDRIERAKPGDLIEVRDANSIRDFLHAEMVVDSILYLCAARHVGVVNIASGRGIAVGRIANRIINLSGKPLSVRETCSENPTRLVADVKRMKSIVSAVNKD